MVLRYEMVKKIIVIELSNAWEESYDEAHEWKPAHYESLLRDCREKGWQVWHLLVERDCMRFLAQQLG